MLPRKTLLALIFVLAAAGAAYFAVSRKDPRAVNPKAAAPALLPALSAAKIDGLTIVNGKDKSEVVLSRKDGEWQVNKPYADKADADAVKRTLKALEDMTVNPEVVARDKSSWEQLKVRDQDVVTVHVVQGGAEAAVLHLGGGEFARIGDAGEVYRVRKISHYELAKEPRLWRDRQVLHFDPKKVATVRVTLPGGATAAAKRTPAAEPPPPAEGQPPAPPQPDTWTLVDGQATVGDLDPAAPTALAQTLSHLDAYDVAEGTSAAAAGLDPPAMTLEVTLEDGTDLTLLVGKTEGDYSYVQSGGQGRIWKVQKAQIANVAREPLQWRSKTLADLVPTDVTHMELTYEGTRMVFDRAGDDWKLVAPAGGEVSQPKLKSLAGAMRNLRGASIAAPGVKGTGLDKPTAVAVFQTADKKKVTLTIGAKQDATWYVKASGRPEVMLMNDYMARRFFKRPDDFKPDKQPPPGGPGGRPPGM